MQVQLLQMRDWIWNKTLSKVGGCAVSVKQADTAGKARSQFNKQPFFILTS